MIILFYFNNQLRYMHRNLDPLQQEEAMDLVVRVDSIPRPDNVETDNTDNVV